MFASDLPVLCSLDITELYVHHAERQQPNSSKDLTRRYDGTLQEEHLVSCKAHHKIPITVRPFKSYLCFCVTGMTPKPLMSLQLPAFPR